MTHDNGVMLICSTGSAVASKLERWLSPRYPSIQRCFMVADLIRHFDEGPPDLVIADVSEGQYEFVRLAKRLRQRVGTQTVVVAAGEVATERPLSTMAGADAVLFQPMNEAATVAHVQLLIQLIYARRDLEQARVQLDALALSRQNGLALLNPDGGIAFHNRALSRMFGYTAEQIQRMKIWELATPAGRRAVRRANVDLKDDQHGVAGIVARWQRRDGQLVDIEIDAHRYFEQDEVGGLIFEVRDIADELAMRQILLEQPLANADAAMLVSRLEELKAQVEALDAAMDAEAPLESLRALTAAARATLDRVLSTNLPVEDVDLAAVVREVLDQHTRHRDAEDARVEVSVAPALPPVRGRATELRRMIANFVADAVAGVRARPAGGDGAAGMVRLTVERGPAVEGEPPRVVLTVEDNGLPAEHFTRTDNRVSMRLDRARSRISLWGGAVYVGPSSEDAGARVTLSLAVAGETAEVAPAPAPAHREILLVEDEVQEHQIIGATLQRAGYRVTGVADARAAERVLHERRFDLIIIDANVPEAASERGVTRLRHFAPEIPVVMIGAGGAALEGAAFDGRVLEADGIEEV
ncbi:MAG: response regulator, partial [Dehalococcoidia bacterium]